MVYTFSNEEAKTEIPSLRRALKTKNRKIISEYIKTNLEQKKNPKLTKTLEKSTQKTGNCSIANAIDERQL